MAKHRGTGEPDDAFVGAVLRAEGDRYAPDAARIRSRIDAGLARGSGRLPARLRLVPPLAVAGAVAATLVGVVVLVERAPDTASPDVTPPVVAGSTSTAPSRPTPSASGSPLPPPSPSSVPSVGSGAPPTPARSGPTSARDRSTTTASPSPGTTRPPGSDAGRAVATTVAGLPAQLSLPATGGEIRDWVVVGARNDGKPVRQKNGAGLIGVPEAVSGPAAPATAPVNVLWSGGIPEQDRAVNGTWWTAPSGATAFRIRLGTVDRPSRVTLYLGAEGTTVQVRASVDGLRGTGSSATVSPGAKAAVTITLDQPAVGHTLTIEVGAANSGSSGTIGLAAVVLH